MPPASVPGTLARPYVWLYAGVLVVFLVLVWMVLVNLCLLNAGRPAQVTLDRLAAVLESDRAFAPQPLADLLGDVTYAAIFKLSGIDGAVIAATTPGAHLSLLDEVFVESFVRPHTQEVAVLMQSARLVGVRIAILLEVAGSGLLVIVPALLDGWMQRYVRRACAGRESSSIYHRAKRVQWVGGLLVVMFYITLPLAIDPMWLYAWIPLAAGCAFLQTKFYKKYL